MNSNWFAANNSLQADVPDGRGLSSNVRIALGRFQPFGLSSNWPHSRRCQVRQVPSFSSPRGRRILAPVRSALGRDAPNPLTRMGPAPGFGRPAPAGFGMGSVGRGGSVGAAKTRSRFFGLLAPNRALRWIENPRVDGSIPSLATTSKSMICMRFRVSPADYPWPGWCRPADYRKLGRSWARGGAAGLAIWEPGRLATQAVELNLSCRTADEWTQLRRAIPGAVGSMYCLARSSSRPSKDSRCVRVGRQRWLGCARVPRSPAPS